MNDKLSDFKKELRELLLKYNAWIGLTSDDGSDWHGITGEKIIVEIDNETYDLNEQGLFISANDLK